MENRTLFTIGHSNRELDEFVDLLTQHGITAIADVRSSPYSRYSPQFNRETLKDSLKLRNIDYVFLGDELGARRTEPNCYVNGVAKYELIAKTRAFQQGVNRLRRGSQSRRIALMCSEKDPLTCHRTILVCRHLKSEFQISHIVDQGEIEDQAAADRRLLDLVKISPRPLLQTHDELIEEAYDKQGGRIAYREETRETSQSSE